jgi:GTPase SAR1 family protein
MFLELAELGLTLGTKAFAEGGKARTATQRQLSRFHNKGELQIVIFGSGGVGKTSLANLLICKSRLGDIPAQYSESPGIEKLALPGNLACHLLVAPGQPDARLSQWPELYRHLGKGKTPLVINVVAYGHHAVQGSFLDTPVGTENFKNQDSFFTAFTHSKRTEEIELIEELFPRLCDAPDPLSMITLVTKQDLWWPERDQVKSFYGQGRYNTFIEQVRQKRGDRNFRHVYWSTSLGILNYQTGRNELLRPNAEGYDQSLQQGNYSRLVESILNLTKEGK